MDLPEDLTERIREGVRRSLLPGAEMPEDGEGLYGRVDPVKMDRELEQLGRVLFTFVPHLNSPFRPGEVPGSMRSLQLMAPFWDRAEVARRARSQDFDNPTLRSLEASIRRGTYIMSHVTGHEARFPARSKQAVRYELARFMLVPVLTFTVLTPVVDAVSTLRPDAPATWVRTLKSTILGFMVGVLVLAIVLAPSLPAIIRGSDRPKDT